MTLKHPANPVILSNVFAFSFLFVSLSFVYKWQGQRKKYGKTRASGTDLARAFLACKVSKKIQDCHICRIDDRLPLWKLLTL